MKRIVDSRLGSWPKLYEGPQGVEMRMNILTPIRYSLAKYVILLPLVTFWQCILSLLIIDLVLSSVNLWTVFQFLSVGRGVVYLSVVGALLLWQCELLSGCWLTRFVFGKRLRLRVVKNQLWVMGRIRKKIYDLHHAPTFGLRSFDQPQDEVYKGSMKLDLNVQNTLRILIAEVFDRGTAQKVVANANMLLHLGTQSSERELDIDPTRVAR